MLTNTCKILALGCCLILPQATLARVQDDVQSWWTVLATGTVYQGMSKTNFKYWLEGVERFGDYNSRVTQQMFRPGLGYALNEQTSFWLGTAWIDTRAPLTPKPVEEKRIWQQLLWVKKYPHLTLTSRLRFEQRFFSNNPSVGWRVRKMLKMVSPLVSNPKWSFVGSDELFWHKSNIPVRQVTGVDQNRLFMGMGYKINKAITLEVGYLNQYIIRPNNADFLANILAANVLFNFN